MVQIEINPDQYGEKGGAEEHLPIQNKEKNIFDKREYSDILGTNKWIKKDDKVLFDLSSQRSEISEQININKINNIARIRNHYVEKVKQIPSVKKIYQFFDEDGWIKIWSIIEEHDSDIKDKIYDIELDILEKFPEDDIDFRVMVSSDDKSTRDIPDRANKIYEKSN